jgi:hypothetical protein
MCMHQVRRKVMIQKKNFHEELQQVFNHIPKYHIKILLGGFNAILRRVIFSNRQLGMRVYTMIAMIMVIE